MESTFLWDLTNIIMNVAPELDNKYHTPESCAVLQSEFDTEVDDDLGML